ncbi:MAG: hypothetical protein KGL74_01305 [Elusimicrobia bacterium]|nr:hypothetical protein [Elusimicrobiota bacterium]
MALKTYLLAGIWEDEAVQGLIAVESARGAHVMEAFYGLPWMKDSYQGALKSMILIDVFRFFGVSVKSLRLTTITFGAIFIVGTLLLTARRWEIWWVAALGLILATDPALIIASAYDTGPTALSLALKGAGLWLLAGWARAKPNLGRLVLGGACLGAAVWDKANFAWALFGLAAAVAIMDRALLTRDKAATGAIAGGVFLGAFPLIAYNVVYPLDTIRNPGHQGWPLSEHLAHLPHWLAVRGQILSLSFQGRPYYEFIAGSDPGFNWVLAAAMAAGALTAVAVAASARRSRLREFGFWSLFLTAGFAAAVVSPMPVKWHHLYALYPLHWFLAFSALRAAPPRPRRAARPVLLVLLALVLANNVRTYREFEADLRERGGSSMFYRGSSELADGVRSIIRDEPGTVLICGDYLGAVLTVASGGAARCQSLSAVVDEMSFKKERFSRLLAEGKIVWVRRASEFRHDGDGSADFLLEALDRLPSNSVLNVYGSNGEPWAYVRRSRRSTEAEARALWSREMSTASHGAPAGERRAMAIALQSSAPGKAYDLLSSLDSPNRGSPVSLRDRAVASHFAGRDDEAIRLLERGLVLDPGLASARLTLVAVLRDKGLLEKSRSVLLSGPLECSDPDREVCRVLAKERKTAR